jgi:hypothetical protein
MEGLGPAFPPRGPSVRVSRAIERDSLPPRLLAQADGVAKWLVVYHGVYQQFTCVDRTSRASLPDGVRLAIIVSPRGST